MAATSSEFYTYHVILLSPRTPISNVPELDQFIDDFLDLAEARRCWLQSVNPEHDWNDGGERILFTSLPPPPYQLPQRRHTPNHPPVSFTYRIICMHNEGNSQWYIRHFTYNVTHYSRRDLAEWFDLYPRF